MQTLEKRNTYTPTNAPQVRCNCDPSLNRGEAVEETLSVLSLKAVSNNSDVDQLPIRKEKKRQNLRVSSPSIKQKLNTRINFVNNLTKILPRTSVNVEVASFDTQNMQNPEISGIEYQQGELQGYEIREYLLEKYNRTGSYCRKANVSLEVEHIIPESRGESDKVSNLTISCHKCNQKKGNKTAEEFSRPEVQKQAKESLKSAAFMNTIRREIVNILKCDCTYGYITKHDRIKLGIDKSHVNDAFVIAGDTNQTRMLS